MIRVRMEMLLRDHYDIEHTVNQLFKRILRALYEGHEYPIKKSLFSHQGNTAEILIEPADEEQAAVAGGHAMKQIAEELQLQFIRQHREENRHEPRKDDEPTGD